MAIIRLKGNSIHGKNLFYEFDTSTIPLGEGGMGKVYRGKQISEITGLSRDVAIKFMFDGLPKSVIDRARREASIQVESENLVEMMDFIETTAEGPKNTIISHYHVVSELLTGVMLADLMNGVTTTKDGVEVPFAQRLYKMYQEDRGNFALIVMKNVSAGIMTLHDKGFIHRDIDPTNIMITIDGKIKLIDFGIAKKLPNFNTTGSEKLTTQDRSLTMTGQFMGKPQYAAPELVVGDIDYQNETTDIYAMGILFYQLLVGKLPFTGPVTKVLEAQKSQKTPVKNIINVNDAADFRAVVAKATEKDQDKRYQSAAEFRVALDAIGTGIGKAPWKKYILVTLATLIVVGSGVYALVNGIDFNKTIEQELYEISTAKAAWKKLQSQNDAQSLFLQSRIYNKNIDLFSDSVATIKDNLKDVVSPDNEKSLYLLEKAYELDSDNVYILFQLGDTYYDGIDDEGSEQDLEKSATFFLKALDCAQKANNRAMIVKTQARVEDLEDIIKGMGEKEDSGRE